MIRFALIVASALGFVLTAALGNLMAPLFRALEASRAAEPPRQAPPAPEASPEKTPEEPEEERSPQASPLGGLCLMVGTLAAVGVGWAAACLAQPELLGDGSQLTTRLLIALAGALGLGAVGAADDWVRLRRRAPLGLRRGPRLALEAGVAAAVLVLLALRGCLPTGLTLPWLGYRELGGAAAPLWELGLVALAECARLANGADGVVCGTAFVAMLGLMCAMTALGWFPLGVLPAAAAGALMAFLLWNFPPAKLRPGTSGALFLAGLLGGLPLCMGWPGLALPLGLPYWLEGGMVALQVLWYRLSGGKLLFACAPLDRWLAARGCGPVGLFYRMCAVALGGLALTLVLLRAV